MSDWDVKIAKLFKERENQSRIGPIIGQVVAVDPVKVSIFEGNATLSGNNLYCNSSLLKHSKTCVINGEKILIEFENELNIGDKVLVIPTESEQKFFLINKLSKI